MGDRIAVARKVNRMTQRQLAGAALISVSQLRKIEQGTRAVTPAVLACIARALGIDDSQLSGDPRPDVSRVHQAILPIRWALDCYDLPDDEQSQPLNELRSVTVQATMHRLASQYTRLADMLPGLLNDLHRASLTTRGHDQETVFALLTLAYRAADAIAAKHGFTDLSARAIELMRLAAARSADPLLGGMSAYVRAELFLRGPHTAAGLRSLSNAAESLQPGSSRPALATYGALHMRAAVLAARAGLPRQTEPHLDEARDVARHIPDGVYHGTAFGPSSVRIHDIAVATEQGDAGRALTRARGWQPPPAVPAERRSHYFIELARAHLWAGDHGKALSSLYQARQIAPQHTRCNSQAHKTLLTLIRLQRHPPDRLLSFAAWAGVK